MYLHYRFTSCDSAEAANQTINNGLTHMAEGTYISTQATFFHDVRAKNSTILDVCM